MPVARWLLVSCLVGLTGFSTACQSSKVGASLPEEMVLVPAGWFWMGESDGPVASRPAHLVYLDRFAMDRTEVTNEAYAVFLETSREQASLREWDGSSRPGNEPVVGINWEAAQAYCHWAGKRLPSEAEWEKAARGRERRRYPWGATWKPGLANTAQSKTGRVLPVGSYPAGASPYGAFDMCGNAAEWVSDYFSPAYYSLLPAINPQGQVKVLDHGLRGGSWDSSPDQATTFFRDSSHSVLPNLRVGFRCAMSLDD